jgi:hypothetical protein
MSDIADRSIEINRNMRVALHELLAMTKGLGETDRRRLVPKIEAALNASKDMPTAYDVIAAKGGVGR